MTLITSSSLGTLCSSRKANPLARPRLLLPSLFPKGIPSPRMPCLKMMEPRSLAFHWSLSSCKLRMRFIILLHLWTEFSLLSWNKFNSVNLSNSVYFDAHELVYDLIIVCFILCLLLELLCCCFGLGQCVRSNSQDIAFQCSSVNWVFGQLENCWRYWWILVGWRVILHQFILWSLELFICFLTVEFGLNKMNSSMDE